MADYLDIVTSDKGVGLVPFWIKNDRQVHFTYGSRKYFPDFLMLYKDMIYVVEGKGEKFFDNKKHQLLQKLNEAPGDDIIKKYQGIMVLDSYADDFKEDVSWSDFVENANASFEKFRNSLEIESTVEEDLKYKTYLPLYTPKNAHRRFYKKQTKVKITGWVKVPENDYPKTSIALKVIGGLLSPKYKANDIIILNTDFKKQEIKDNVVMVYNKSIEDYYEPKGFTIRKLVINKVDDGSMFGANQVILESLNSAYPKIILDKLVSENELDIIGTEYII